jgi:hypothetical protein
LSKNCTELAERSRAREMISTVATPDDSELNATRPLTVAERPPLPTRQFAKPVRPGGSHNGGDYPVGPGVGTTSAELMQPGPHEGRRPPRPKSKTEVPAGLSSARTKVNMIQARRATTATTQTMKATRVATQMGRFFLVLYLHCCSIFAFSAGINAVVDCITKLTHLRIGPPVSEQ